MTMKSVYIVFITSCFLWTMSDNKTYLILSYKKDAPIPRIDAQQLQQAKDSLIAHVHVQRHH